MLEPLWKNIRVGGGGGGGAQVGIETTTSWLLDRRHTTHRDCPMATAGSIHTIAGGTALIYQSMIYFNTIITSTKLFNIIKFTQPK